MINEGMGVHRVYVDETGLSLHISRSRERAAVGERASRVVSSQRGRNMTVIMAISDQVGMLYYEVVWTAPQRTPSTSLAGDILTSLGTFLEDEPGTVVMDNAPAHRRAEPSLSNMTSQSRIC